MQFLLLQQLQLQMLRLLLLLMLLLLLLMMIFAQRPLLLLKNVSVGSSVLRWDSLNNGASR